MTAPVGGERTSRRWTLTVLCGGAVLCWAGLASAWGSPIDAMRMGLVLFLLGFCGGGFGLAYMLVTARNPVEHSGTVTAFINIGIFLGAGTIQFIPRTCMSHHTETSRLSLRRCWWVL